MLICNLALITLLLLPSAIIGSRGSLTDNAFQEIAHIDCKVATDAPSLYSQPKEIEVHRVQWNPSKELLAVWCTNTPSIYIFNTNNDLLQDTLSDPTPQGDEGEAEILWSPDGNYLLKTTHWDIDIWKIDGDDAKYVKSFNRIANHLSISWNPNSRYFADVEGEDTARKVSIYDVSQFNVIGTFDSNPQQIQHLLWSLDGKTFLASTSDDEIELWDASTYRLIKKISAYNERLIVWRSKNEAIGVYCSTTTRECTLWLLDITSFVVTKPFENTIPLTFSVFQVSSDGNLLAADIGSGQVSIFDIPTGKTYAEFKADSRAVTTLSWNPTNALLATGGGDGVVRIWQYTEKSN